MANIDRSPAHLFEDLPEEQKYRFTVLNRFAGMTKTIRMQGKDRRLNDVR